MLSSLQDDAYQVQLPAFEGPLDLLLALIEREKLDISAISLAVVTDQFLAYVRQLEEADATMLADFLVVAAKLIWIKSRLLLPRPPAPPEEEEEDPAEALARQLREYKRFKEAANSLRSIEEQGLHTYLRVAELPELERRLDNEGISLAELLSAAQSALHAIDSGDAADLPNGMVVPFTLTIHDQILHIRSLTANGKRITFRSLLSHARHRLEVIVTLLAVLELIKRGQALVIQEQAFGDIYIERAAGAPSSHTQAEAPNTTSIPA